ncbi:unnamed protein product [Rotaria magnacalcarata]|uniref:Uncharacterized protein n=1 Tax=Rotaria magnacalcarata TaxID=392030 RepID=A0A819VZ72_9BILA|nr:unnamed protein product [Rotaria magnacalcarata]CAF2194603.1 unnamed protein product [Rotaria magnacalcarata]CAF4048897.1 unnamed protein product [Rotaria magnacalcarata]CAF4117491.1 unnamed protein product [Rotaria magnacalcarata]
MCKIVFDKTCVSVSKTNSTMKEQEKHESRRRPIIHEFCLHTPTQALPGIARSQSIHNRLFSLISFIGFTIIMAYVVSTTVLAYFEYPTQIDINYASERPQYFPAFTRCNASPLRFDKN